MFIMTSAKLTPEIRYVLQEGDYCWWEWKLETKFIRGLLLSHEVQKGPPCFLSSFSELLGAAGSNLSLRLKSKKL